MERLYDSAARGDVEALHKLLENDTFLLERVSYTTPNNTPLHVAAMKGHLPYVKEILTLSPLLAEVLNSEQSSPLHVASARGNLEIASKLLEAAPDMCLSRDSQGRNPLHLAAIKGHIKLLEVLVSKAPLAAREKVGRGHTALHLCVQHNQLEALKVLVKEVKELIDAINDDGDTILHMAVNGKKVEIKEYLETTNMDFQTIQHHKKRMWLTRKRDSIMVVAILIATMAFQAGVTPPGGVWQDDFTHHDNGTLVVDNPHRAGEAVMANNHPLSFKSFMQANTVAFVSSLSTILLLISGLPFRRPLFMWALMMIMWLTVTSIAVTYVIAIIVVTPNNNKKSLSSVIEISLVVWCGVMAILLVGNTVRLIHRWLRKEGYIKRRLNMCGEPV